MSTPVSEAPNLLMNGGFEDGIAPWVGSFFPQTTTAESHGGTASLELVLGTSAAQSIISGEVPEFVSGFYRVADWPDNSSAYLEVVVTVLQADPAANRDVHLVIAGIDREPAPFASGSFVFLSRDAPEVGLWTYFSYPLHDAFNATGGGPATWAGFDIAVAVSGEGDPRTAYYDDLYVGTQVGNPNRPTESEAR